MEKLSKGLPAIAILLIIISSIKLAIYYDVFNINIVDYVGVTEYIPLFINDLHHLGLFLVPGIIGAIVGITYERRRLKAVEKSNGIKPVTGKRQLKYIAVFIILIAVPLVFTLLYFETFFEKLYYIQFIAFFVFLLPLTLPTKKTKKWFYYSCCLFGLVISGITIGAYKDAYKILEGKSDDQTRIIFKDKSIILEDNINYIGKSENYLFLFDTLNHVAIVKKVDEIEEIQITLKQSNDIPKKN